MSALAPLYARVKSAARSILPARVRSLPRLLWAKFSYLTFKSHIIRHRYGAYQLMEVIDAESARWFDRDLDELPDLGFLSQHRLIPGAKVLNIGANQGLLAMLLAKVVEPSGSLWPSSLTSAKPTRRAATSNSMGYAR